jgi:putative redox protein
MELVLMGVAGCSAIDMISILKKQSRITSFKSWLKEKCASRRSKTFQRHSCGVYLEGEIKEDKAAKSHNFLLKNIVPFQNFRTNSNHTL